MAFVERGEDFQLYKRKQQYAMQGFFIFKYIKKEKMLIVGNKMDEL